MIPPSLDDLVRVLYDASTGDDRSRVADALDSMLTYIEYWVSVDQPQPVAVLFDQLAASRLFRAVGQTLLAATTHPSLRSRERTDFLQRFVEDLSARCVPETTIRRLQEHFR